MNTSLKFGIAAILAAFLAGCTSVKTVIRVRQDGSGTVERTVLVSNESVQPFDTDSTQETFGNETYDSVAASMGQGVYFISSHKISTEDGEGRTTIFRFDDINRLHLDLLPGTSDSSQQSMQSERRRNGVSFVFEKGSPAKLTVKTPPKKQDEKVKTGPSQEQSKKRRKMALTMMRTLLNHLRMTALVEVEGSIVETNATFKDPNSVTLMDIDFDKLLSNEANLDRISEIEDLSIDDQRTMMKEMKGLKVELLPEVYIKFR